MTVAGGILAWMTLALPVVNPTADQTVAPLAPAAAQCQSTPMVNNARRVALIIANSDYDNGWKPLVSPARDQELLASALAQSGFSVAILCNGEAAETRDILDRFARVARHADAALIYYAGHGLERAGRNYLVPVRAAAEQSYIPADMLIDALTGAKVALIMLDACRTEIISNESAAANMLGNASTFRIGNAALGFATARGRPAFDAAPPSYRHSPFAESLAEHLPIPGLELNDLFDAIRRDVRRRTAIFTLGPQDPWLINQLGGKFHFLPPLDAKIFEAPGIDAGPRLDIDMRQLESGDELGVALELLVKRGIPAIFAWAKAGDSNAQYILAFMIANQVGVGAGDDHGLGDAYDWLDRAAKANNPAALTQLGFFELNQFDEQADKRAQALFVQAAAMGFARADHYLGNIAKAAESGDAYSAFLLADRGEVDKGIALLSGMAEAGNEAADNWLCEIGVIHGRINISLESCEIAARAGYAGAQTHLAHFYSAVDNGEASAQTARHWAALGHPTIYFEFDRFQPRGINQQVVIDKLLAALNRRPWNRIVIEGHTDIQATREYALALTERVANAVKGKLVESGIAPEKIDVISYGRERPSRKAFGFEPLNRRAVVKVEWADAASAP